jgi:hypothetical protein
MTIVDAEGRLFGRWNFVDVVVVVLLLAIGPLGYAAFVLFRSPDPRIVSIEPAEVLEGPNQRVVIRGTNLRPYMRLSFNNVQGRTFLFQDSTRAEVDLNEMPPGKYDVVLYDFGQERHRVSQALTVKPNSSLTPTQDVIVVGRFIGLSQADAALIRKGMPLPFPGELLDAAAPRQSVPRVYFGLTPIEVNSTSKLEVPAAIKVACFVKLSGGMPECGRSDFTLRPIYVLTIPTSGTTALSFQIDQVRGIQPVQEVRARVQLLGPVETLAVAARGDVEVEPQWNPFSLGSRIESIDPAVPGQTARLATLTMRVQRISSGLWNGVAPLRAGAQVPFATSRYVVSALVLSINE